MVGKKPEVQRELSCNYAVLSLGQAAESGAEIWSPGITVSRLGTRWEHAIYRYKLVAIQVNQYNVYVRLDSCLVVRGTAAVELAQYLLQYVASLLLQDNSVDRKSVV